MTPPMGKNTFEHQFFSELIIPVNYPPQQFFSCNTFTIITGKDPDPDVVINVRPFGRQRKCAYRFPTCMQTRVHALNDSSSLFRQCEANKFITRPAAPSYCIRQRRRGKTERVNTTRKNCIDNTGNAERPLDHRSQVEPRMLSSIAH